MSGFFSSIRFVSLILLSVASIAQAQNNEWLAKPASESTIRAQQASAQTLPADNGSDSQFVEHGFIATLPNPVIKNAEGEVVIDATIFDWMQGEAPDTVNPSLWRQMKLLRRHGLFKVTDGVWQVRGLDPANMTIVEGETGWIIIDTLLTTETAAAAMSLVDQYLGKRPVTGVIYSHSHPDHFGGVRALVDPDNLPPIIAPEHLVKEAVAEFVLVGNTIGRRGDYQLGNHLSPGPTGYVGTGLIGAVSNGTVSLIPPSDSIKRTGETRMIDGVEFEFQMVPETEAPSEMNVFLPEQKFFYIGELTSCTMHNIQTPRGALARDALSWAGYLTEAIRLYGNRADALATGHCWPRIGREAVINYLSLQRDNYKYLHDQTVRMMNQGATPLEIAEQLRPPSAITNEWSNRGYYGTHRHNAKGVFQRYVGWWDGNPANLNLYPAVDRARRYVGEMGGSRKVIRKAKRAMAEGDYRWSTELLNHLHFADPANDKARALLADSFEQLGYQAESAIWRNYYLTGAKELRQGIENSGFVESPDLALAMTTESLFDILAVQLHPEKIGDAALSILFDISDTGEMVLVRVNNSVLVAEIDRKEIQYGTTVTGNRNLLLGYFLRRKPLNEIEAAGLDVAGDRSALETLWRAIEPPNPVFNVVSP